MLQPLVYEGVSPGTDVPGFRDITSGDNGAYWPARAGTPAPASASRTARRC